MFSGELDAKCSVKIDRWIDIDSAEAKEFGHVEFTKKLLKLGFQYPPFLFVDELGRIFGKSDNGYYPLHDEFCGEKIGYRIVKKAAN